MKNPLIIINNFIAPHSFTDFFSLFQLICFDFMALTFNVYVQPLRSRQPCHSRPLFSGLQQSRAKRRVDIRLTLIRWTETRLQLNANVALCLLALMCVTQLGQCVVNSTQDLQSSYRTYRDLLCQSLCLELALVCVLKPTNNSQPITSVRLTGLEVLPMNAIQVEYLKTHLAKHISRI